MIPILLALSCFPVDGPKLLARHLAAAVPEFARLAPDTDLGYAPVPGAVRTLRSEDLLRIGAGHGVTVTPPAQGACFEWTLQPLDSAAVTAAMRRSLPEDAQVEVLEISRMPVPAGTLEFPLETLKAGVWRGSVRYGANGRYDVWARVRVGVKQTRVVAAVALKAGERISADQLRVEEVDTEPGASYVSSIDEVVGMQAKRPFSEGSPLVARMLDRPAAILKGDTVRLHAKFGAAHIITDALAQTSGRIGEMISVKNVASGRVLRARVETSGEVVLAQ